MITVVLENSLEAPIILTLYVFNPNQCDEMMEKKLLIPPPQKKIG